MSPVSTDPGPQLPKIGFGTARLGDEQAVFTAVSLAITAGYRLIDTAKIYDNEQAVGRAVRESGMPREELFITSKLWNDQQGAQQTIAACHESLMRLGLEYLDLYLIHWPATSRRHASWQAFEQLYDEGLIKHAGVSNYTISHLRELQERSSVMPAVNQVEFHPFIYEQQRPLLDYCAEQGIVVQAYCPITRAVAVQNETISTIAEQYKKTQAQIVLRWCVQHGTVPLPRSAQPAHAASNLQIFDFELSAGDMQQLDNLSDGVRVTWDPASMGQ